MAVQRDSEILMDLWKATLDSKRFKEALGNAEGELLWTAGKMAVNAQDLRRAMIILRQIDARLKISRAA